MEPSSLPKPQPVIIPAFSYPLGREITKTYKIGARFQIPLSPFVSVPVSFQWQVTSIYLPMRAVATIIKSKEAAKATVSVGIVGRLLRDGEIVWVAQEAPAPQLLASFPEAEEAFYTSSLLLAEDFNNPIVVSPANRLELELEGTVTADFAEEPGEATLENAVIIGGPPETPPVSNPLIWPTQGILHYSLYTGS